MTQATEQRRERRLRRRLYLLRSCDGCTACCTIMRVDELDKPAGKTCEHLVPGGCGIYESRPSGCRGWACIWRSGTDLLHEDERPDKIGVMLDTWAPKDCPEARAILVTKAPGAELSEKTGEMLRRIIEEHVVVFMDEPRQVMGPKEKVAAFVQAPTSALP